jgi:hypothetical protein
MDLLAFNQPEKLGYQFVQKWACLNKGFYPSVFGCVLIPREKGGILMIQKEI